MFGLVWLGRRDTNPFDCDKFVVISLRAHLKKNKNMIKCHPLTGNNMIKYHTEYDKISYQGFITSFIGLLK